MHIASKERDYIVCSYYDADAVLMAVGITAVSSPGFHCIIFISLRNGFEVGDFVRDVRNISKVMRDFKMYVHGKLKL